jgi:hypothetical protein
MPIFDPAHLGPAVTAALAAADVGTDTNALLAVVTRDAAGVIGVQGVYSQRLGTHWTVAALFAIDHAQQIAGGIQVKATW